MRKVAPIWWNEQPKGVGAFGDGGYWVVTKHKDVKEVSRRSDVFSSNRRPRCRATATRPIPRRSRRGKVVLLNQDAPHHTHLRKIISRGFTPRAIESPARRAPTSGRSDIAKAAAAEGSGDFVEQVSCELPLQAIAGLIGVPQEDRKKLFDWSNQMVGDEDPEFARNDPTAASVELIMYGMQMAARAQREPRRRHRHQAGPGRRRGPQAHRRRVRLLRHPAGGRGQRDDPQLDHPGHDGVHRIPRPVGAVQDGAAGDRGRRDRPLGHAGHRRSSAPRSRTPSSAGVQIKKGQRVVMFYRSANFDEDVFDDPYTFNILRDPNPHVGFGGTGAHYCIGANLARMTIDLIFNAIADQMPDLTPISAAGAAAVGLAQRHQALAGRLSRRVEARGCAVVG